MTSSAAPAGRPAEPDLEDDVPALGLVPLEGRGSLPFALVHGESLVAAASWSLGEAGAELFDLSVAAADLVESGRDLVVHDPLCPLTPASFIADAVRLSRGTGAVVVGTRPVTDTVREAGAGESGPSGVLDLGPTQDRDDLVVVTSPVVLPAAVLAGLLDRPGAVLDDLLADLPDLVARLLREVPVRLLEAPGLGRRVGDEEELGVLAALSASRSDG